ncbi:uncharacterized protein LOC115996101 [Ipomoea triloba]|uniref:uncharacterized protein LOC115996101 n=1 Tax=Ipomoea triloba TaxID=35885 RepID=UPI00125E6E90|nr:uncharacterized protein LOC115996101 [Ipomoea triloba]
MYLAVGRHTSCEVWESITAALGSSTRARCLNLLGQFQSLYKGGSTTAEYLGRAQLLVEDLALADQPVSLDEQNLYVFRGLRSEFRPMASSLTVSDNLVSISQLADYLQAQEYIYADEFTLEATVMVANRGRRNNGEGHFGGRQGQNGGQRRIRGRQGRGGQGRGRDSAPRCQICRSHGHTALYCYKRFYTSIMLWCSSVCSKESSSIHWVDLALAELSVAFNFHQNLLNCCNTWTYKLICNTEVEGDSLNDDDAYVANKLVGPGKEQEQTSRNAF